MNTLNAWQTFPCFGTNVISDIIPEKKKKKKKKTWITMVQGKSKMYCTSQSSCIWDWFSWVLDLLLIFQAWIEKENCFSSWEKWIHPKHFFQVPIPEPIQWSALPLTQGGFTLTPFNLQAGQLANIRSLCFPNRINQTA